MALATFIFWLSVAMIFYAYFGYPLILFAVNKVKRKPLYVSAEIHQKLSISIIITCRNEERVIAEKLENTLALSYRDGKVEGSTVEIIVASDASDDRTDEICLGYSGRGVKLIRVDERKGKEFAQAKAVEVAISRKTMETVLTESLRIFPKCLSGMSR